MPLARINLKLEIIDGPDTGYIIEETNKVINLERTEWGGTDFKPYKVTLEFVTPDIIRKKQERYLKEDDDETKSNTPS